MTAVIIPPDRLAVYSAQYWDARSQCKARTKLAPMTLIASKDVILVTGMAGATPIPVPPDWVGKRVNQVDPASMLSSFAPTTAQP
jgi:hypothetical protein